MSRGFGPRIRSIRGLFTLVGNAFFRAKGRRFHEPWVSVFTSRGCQPPDGAAAWHSNVKPPRHPGTDIPGSWEHPRLDSTPPRPLRCRRQSKSTRGPRPLIPIPQPRTPYPKLNEYRTPSLIPPLGCLTILAVLGMILMLPFLLADVMKGALVKLDLSPTTAGLAVIGIFLGGLINLPVRRIERADMQPVSPLPMFGMIRPQPQQFRPDTIIAVNVGGCLIPVALAAWQILRLVRGGGWPVGAMGIAAAVNVAVCYRASRPVPGIGILLPGFIAAAAAVGMSWLLLMESDYASQRAPVAFVAGVVGPLVGADLLRLRDILRVPVGMLSIGGAGTFDGIVLSSFLAALLA